MLIGNAGEFERQGLFTLLLKRNKTIKRQHGKDIAVSIVNGLDFVTDSPACSGRYSSQDTQGWEMQFPAHQGQEMQFPAHTGLDFTASTLQTEARAPDSVIQKKECRALSCHRHFYQIPKLPQDPLLFGSFGVRRSGGNILPTSSCTLVESKATENYFKCGSY